MQLDTRLLYETLLISAKKYPDKCAVEVAGTSYTYRQLLDSALKIAEWLKSKGLRCGDRVAVYLDNSWPCCVSVFGISLAGGVFFIINPQTKQDKLEYMLNDCNASFLISDSHLFMVYNPILNRISSLGGLIYSGEYPETPDFKGHVAKFSQVLETTKQLESPEFVIPNDLAALIYTSGSTGNPKGVMMTHQAMVFACGSLIQYLREDEHERIICVIPLAFDYGLYQLLMTVRLGATLILERSFIFPTQIMNRIEESGATLFPGVPTIFATLIGMYKKKNFSFPGIRKITNTAATLPADHIPVLKQIFPNALVFKMYGLTECKRVSYLEPELVDSKPSSVGKSIPGTEMFLLTPEGKAVPPRKIGILHVRGPHVMAGYWNKPEQTSHMLKDGKIPGERILCAQDRFIRDEEGFFYFKGRSDDIIKTRGEKVSPVEVENVLHSIDGIKEAAVIGIPDEVLGQAIKAFIVLDGSIEYDEKMIKKICLSRMENFMVPSQVEFRDGLEKTTSGKISKKGLS